MAVEVIIQDGFEFHELASGIALREEGVEMGHCVGGYAYQCLQRATHIFSVRHCGKRSATMELRATPLGILQIVQIKGPRNHEPDATLVTAASRMVARLNGTLA